MYASSEAVMSDFISLFTTCQEVVMSRLLLVKEVARTVETKY